MNNHETKSNHLNAWESFSQSPVVAAAVTTVMLVMHLVFLVLYFQNGMTVLAVYGSVALLAYAGSYFLAAKGRVFELSVNNATQVLVFTIFNIAFLGWDYGFQLYFFGFLTASFMINFISNGNMRINAGTIGMVVFFIALFVFSGIWFDFHEPLYHFSDPNLPIIISLANGVVTMQLILVFTWVYADTANKLEEELAHIASHDALTDLVNRGKMSELLTGWYQVVAGQEYKRSGKGNKNMPRIAPAADGCLVMIDIDNFKQINDTYGHQAGDRVLMDLAAKLKQLNEDNPGTVSARWGGEEFMVYLPESSKDEAVAVVDGLRQAIADSSSEFGGEDIRWTITAGVAMKSERARCDDLVHLVDSRLYEGKRSGRNAVMA